MSIQGSQQLTYDEFLTRYDGRHAEWVDGKVVLMSPASLRHQDIAGFLYQLMYSFARRRRLGSVYQPPVQMRTGPELSSREPDVLFVSSERSHLLEKAHVNGPADIAVEVVSPESRLRDRGEKFAEYEEGGVREYWIVDPEEERADFFQRDESGRYRRVDPDTDGVYHCRELKGFWLQVGDLWQDPLPDVIDRFGDLGLL